MSGQPEIRHLVTAAFKAWRDAGVDCLVLRNYEGLPDFTTNDIDVLVAPAQLRKAEAVLLDAAARTGFRLHNRAEFATLALYLSHPQTNAQVHFDLFTALKWRGFDFLRCDGFLARKVEREHFAVPHPADEAATNQLASLIFSGKVKEKYQQPVTTGFRRERTAATEVLAASYGSELAEFLVKTGSEGNWPQIEARVGQLRRTLVLRQLAGSPFQTARSLFSDAVRLTRRLLHPPGMIVALCGADGSGKSTAARNMTGSLTGTFSPVKSRHYHWKPPMFSEGRRAARAPVSDPHKQSPRNVFLSLLYFGFHWLEFFLGGWLSLRRVTFRGGLILIDRYYYDFFVDQRRYRLQVPQAIVRLGYKFIKRPDLALLLDAPAEVLQSRKQEVSLEETRRQRDAFRGLFELLREGRIINADQKPVAVADEMVRAILDYLAARTQRRWRNVLPGFWNTLFAPSDSGAGSRLDFRVLCKQGRPLLLLPPDRRAREITLGLYPAQTPRARTALNLLRRLASAGLLFSGYKIVVPISANDDFAGYLRSTGGVAGTALPTLGFLAGNPGGGQQRFVILVFNAKSEPVAVVKAGVSPLARELIAQEAAFLASVPTGLMGIPTLRSNFDSPRVRALALDYFAGESPTIESSGTLPAVLNSWVDEKRRVNLDSTSNWQKLKEVSGAHPGFVAFAPSLADCSFHPVISHGDLAPWNIRIAPAGKWNVLDWERGDLTGIPGWDWFHYVIQPAILVERISVKELAERMEGLLRSVAFRNYAAKTGITGSERPLLLGYLLHVTEVIRPSEGLTQSLELLVELGARWKQLPAG